MGDHFVLLVDRLLTESTLEAAIESRNRSLEAAKSTVDDSELENSPKKIEFGDILTPRKLVECRICQDEDDDSNMETPCSCCGSLKYAHRRCVQRWCNEKGDTTCEICHQQFKPGYTAPPPLFQFGHIPLNFRGNWEISRRELNNPRIIAMVSTDRNFLHSPTYDNYSASATRSLMCCRSIALIFMILLILRHTLPLILDGVNEFTFPLFLILFLRTVGIVLPIYVMVKAVTAFQHHRHQPERPSSLSNEETQHSTTLEPHAQILHAI
ncbi:uncharacterized protein LOC123213532 [Mangifera indica]|uniref:uncharacterized protein LOC123213532 n=1 Tax=Mangifera indica TaxID=29780 RepID=UPI001CFB80C1|nr:uncharacterized protein LOC123213532 [Mangifera indica]XP_044488924.1 uncharacterized protein LOC123213532 [Mangifera indica]